MLLLSANVLKNNELFSCLRLFNTKIFGWNYILLYICTVKLHNEDKMVFTKEKIESFFEEMCKADRVKINSNEIKNYYGQYVLARYYDCLYIAKIVGELDGEYEIAEYLDVKRGDGLVSLNTLIYFNRPSDPMIEGCDAFFKLSQTELRFFKRLKQYCIIQPFDSMTEKLKELLPCEK